MLVLPRTSYVHLGTILKQPQFLHRPKQWDNHFHLPRINKITATLHNVGNPEGYTQPSSPRLKQMCRSWKTHPVCWNKTLYPREEDCILNTLVAEKSDPAKSSRVGAELGFHVQWKFKGCGRRRPARSKRFCQSEGNKCGYGQGFRQSGPTALKCCTDLDSGQPVHTRPIPWGKGGSNTDKCPTLP